MKTLIAIKHVDFEDLGSWESLLCKHYKITYLNVTDIAFSLLNNKDIDLLVVLDGDTFDLPEEATLLASTDLCKNQIFSFGKRALAFQCHPEVSAHGLEKWWIGHAAEISSNHLSVSQLRREAMKLSLNMQKHSLDCLREWLDALTP